MKLKDRFVFAEVGEDRVAVPVGPAARSLHGIVRLNETAAFIWRGLAEGLAAEQIAERMQAEYDVDAETALRAVRRIMDRLVEDGLAEADPE